MASSNIMSSSLFEGCSLGTWHPVLTAGLAPASRAAGLPHTNNLVGVVLVVVVGVAIGEVDDPGIISVVGNRRTRPKRRKR